MPTRLITALCLTVVVAMLLLTACGGDSQPQSNTSSQAPDSDTSTSTNGEQPQEKSLEDLAREEGEFTLYCVYAIEVCQGLADMFNEKYPDITVNIFRQSGGFCTNACGLTPLEAIIMPTSGPNRI